MAGRRNFNLRRRGFLTCAAGAASDLALRGWSGCRNQVPLPTAPFEGVYVDRFTYRQGEPIVVHASLRAPQEVTFKLLRYDTSVVTLVDTAAAFVPNQSQQDEPGVHGAGFASVLSFDTASLPPGQYVVTIPPELMQEENRFNLFTEFESDNSIATFVVTNPTPGAHSRILWLHDSLLGVCYGSFGGQSIYGSAEVRRRTVSCLRPGLNIGARSLTLMRLILENGYAMEYIDLMGLDEEALGYLDAYDLVINVGSVEYVPHNVMAHLQRFRHEGGNLLFSGNEFAAFRVRLDFATRQLTTYKYDYQALDPLYGTGSPLVAGVGMNIPETIPETSLTGLTMWASNRTTQDVWIDLPVYNLQHAGWILEGTGLGPGDALPSALKNFSMGNRVEFGRDNQPTIVDPAASDTFPGTVVWAAAPSPDARAWWLAPPGLSFPYWPSLADGHTIATLQELPGGGRVIGIPSPHISDWNLSNPLYRTMMLNIVAALAGARRL